MGSALAKGCPSAEIQVNTHGDALPSTKDGSGKIVPLAVAEGDDSQSALIDRLGEQQALRRNEIELQLPGHRGYAASAIFCALATASSIVPTM